MTVAEMIEKLSQYPPDMRVEITDGYNLYFYKGNFAFQLFEGDDGETFVDIGVGGFGYE
jgi:hypothetical protein